MEENLKIPLSDGKFEGIMQPIGTIQESKSRKRNRR
jgi:hypothetical protein